MALMLATRLCRAPALSKSTLFVKQPNTVKVYTRVYSEGKDAVTRAARRQVGVKEKLMQPAGETAFNLGKGALAGASVIGIGALAFYGLGLGSEAGALEKQHLWPQYVKDRIKTTYLYFGSSIAVTAASAIAAVRSPLIMNIVMKNGLMGMAISIAAILGTGILARSIPYSEGFGVKQMAWLLHAGTMGAMVAPMCLLGGPLLIKAAWYTAGVVGGLSTIAVCAPSEQFLYMGGPLAMGLGVVFVSSIGSMFFAPTTALGAGLYSISLYGGLILFSGFLLYDTQRIIAQAERYPTNPAALGVVPYDPINASIAIYLDTLNIFIRIATILAGGGQGKRK